jgi:hypothetical protein
LTGTATVAAGTALWLEPNGHSAIKPPFWLSGFSRRL